MNKIIYKHFKVRNLTDKEIVDGAYTQRGLYYHAGRRSLFDYLGNKDHKHYLRFHDMSEYGFVVVLSRIKFYEMISEVRMVCQLYFPIESDIVQDKPLGLYGLDGYKKYTESDVVKYNVTENEVVTYKRLLTNEAVWPSREVEEANRKNVSETIYLADQWLLSKCDLYDSRCTYKDGHLWAEKKYKIKKDQSLYSDYALIEPRSSELGVLDYEGLRLSVNSINLKNNTVVIEQDIGVKRPVAFLLDGDFAYELSLQDSFVTSSSDGDKKYVEKKVFKIKSWEPLLCRFE